MERTHLPSPCRPTRPARTARRPLPWPLHGALALALGLAVLTGACSTLGGPFAEGARGPGGVPAPQAAQISLIVAQTRSQFPELSGTGIPFDARKAPEVHPDRAPELALQGPGVGVQPGLQTGERPRLRAALYLDKQAYASGYLEVTPAGGAAERWSVVAFDQQGAPRKRFDFTYVLATPASQLRYLVLIGGPYQQDGEDYLGYEGTLIEPGPGNDLEHWARAYKLDFGFRFATVPAHQRKVEQAVSAFRELQRDMDRLERLRERIAATEGNLATLRNSEVPADQAARREQQLADADKRLEALRSERDTLVDATEARFVSYYELRLAISNEFAAFTQSNRYSWLDRAGRQEFYDKWKVVEFHHPRIDDLVSAFLTYKEHGGKVLDARSAAMTVITQNDNWAKDPSKASQARPRK